MTTGRPRSKHPAPTSSGQEGAALSYLPHLCHRHSVVAPVTALPNTSLTPSKRQPGLLSSRCQELCFPSGFCDPAPHPPNPGSRTHHQDESTRAGSVSSSSSRRSSRQARLRRAEAREPSAAAGRGAGTGARVRRGESCAASSAPPGLSIALQGRPPRGPEGRGRGTGWGDSGCSYSPPWGAIGSPTAGDLGTPGLRGPGRSHPERGAGSGVRKPPPPH